jgi:hypothetical protein
MVVGKLPFTDASLPMTLQRIQADPLVDLLHRLLHKDPAERITIREIKTHPWLSTMLWDELNDAVSRFGRRTAPSSPDPAVVERMGFMGIDCRALRENLCDEEDTELTMLYHIMRREKITDRMKGCIRFRGVQGRSLKGCRSAYQTSLLKVEMKENVEGLRSDGVKRLSSSAVAQAVMGGGNMSLPIGLRLNRLNIVPPIPGFRQASGRSVISEDG